MKKVSIKTIINAPIEKVWEVLTNIKAYSDWNPFVYDISADQTVPDVGCQMLFSVSFSNGRKTKSKELVTTFNSPQKTDNNTAAWAYRFDGFIHHIYMTRAVRTQKLKVLSDGTTEYSSEEIFTGWGTSFIPLKQVQKGFALQANALKEVCEL
ncbi:hypothetical protein DNU06_15785 [Putridiphycobacter roseus]|uniref:SRPBCC domain-containing protein n=1 Tax=Putridiphycobacter roseus TaxID=2219161 RepID=A0A2W1MXE5_9FLAO|nr:SRPBCC domain-containing protein [Putridiphycobacter roseus]PZE15840.1 hypothetical protein DNU06_15785 [Putridiphycobacter roseus]